MNTIAIFLVLVVLAFVASIALATVPSGGRAGYTVRG